MHTRGELVSAGHLSISSTIDGDFEYQMQPSNEGPLEVRPYGPSESGPESGLTGRHLKPIVSELRWPQTNLS
jgi:hypothetical protein